MSLAAERPPAVLPESPDELRHDLQLVAEMISPGARVLDIGCGDGALLSFLWRRKNVDGRGIELSQGGVNACVSRGLSVIQGDADRDLDAYPKGAFDVVVLSQTLQATREPDRVVANMVRIARRAIVSFPNFGFWRTRLHLLAKGRMPISELLPYAWYDTPNIHLCTIRDFLALIAKIGAKVEHGLALDRRGRALSLDPQGAFANLLAEQAIFILTENGLTENRRTENRRTENRRTENRRTENGLTENGLTENGPS